MRFTSARIQAFRNIRAAEVDFSPQFTAFVGPNGQGKTNTLEALYFTAALRPLRPVTRSSLLQDGAEESRVSSQIQRMTTGLRHDLAVELTRQSRRLRKDGKPAERRAFLGMIVAVAFTPDDLQLGKGGPEGRRRFVDRGVLNGRPAFLEPSLRYAKALKERNRVLLEGGSDATAAAFESILAVEGTEILLRRTEYLEQLAPRATAYFEEIARPAPELSLRYHCTLGPEANTLEAPALRELFESTLHNNRGHDRMRKATTVGPHRDDLEICIDEQSIRDRASQGQHRAVVLALKLGEMAHLADVLGEPPVLLLDDMSSELDPKRSQQLFEHVGHLDGQVILTSTQDPAAFLAPFVDTELVIYDVDRGALRRRPCRPGMAVA